MKIYKIIFMLLMTLTSISCGSGVDSIANTGVCDGYNSSSTSAYILPFVAGNKHEVGQGNCSAVSHYSTQRYAYDFSMDIGTSIVAARSGTVSKVQESYEDGSPCPNNNYIEVLHADGSIASYVHLTKNGALVSLGDVVSQGQAIAQSGNTGCSTAPHLHFVVWKNSDYTDSLPVTFSNTVENDRGLKAGKEYTAQ